MKLNSRLWLILFVAWLGWVFDIMDTALFNFAKGPMMQEFLGTAAKLEGPKVEGQIQTWFLIGWAVGGLLFGVLADRWGRTRTMIATIFLYCAFTGLTALCHSPEQVAVVRFFTALGIGGEWAAGAALVAETFPDAMRAKAAAWLQSAAAFGPAFAAIANFSIPAANWRSLFLVGIAPVFVTILIRLLVQEPPVHSTSKTPFFSPLKELFANPTWRRNALIALGLGIVGIAGAMNISFWLPNLVEQVSLGLNADTIKDRKSVATLVMHIGTLVGVFVSPWLASLVGRKKALLIFFSLTPVALLLATYGGNSWTKLLVLAPLMSFFAIGVSAIFVLYFPELFPSRIRASGSGFAYNTGRIATAAVPLMTGYLATQFGNVLLAVLATSIILLSIGLPTLVVAPETRGQPLPE